MKRFAAAIVLTLGCAGLGAQTSETVNICDRTSKVRDAILAATTDPDDVCGAVSPSSPTGLAGVTGLSVEFQFIASFRVGDFSGLTGLRRLNLGLNRVRSNTLPGDIFSDLTNLRTLSLTHMALETLPANLLSGLIHLQTLDFDGNSLTMLPAGVFSDLTSLLTLDVHGNDLDALPADVFSKLTRLRTLDLHSNSLGALPAGVFSKLTRLRTLDLGGNDLTELSANVFSELINLQTLTLASNLLSTLPASVFSGLTKLQTLNLAGNLFGTLPAGVFSGLTGLTEVDLARNPSDNPAPLTFTVRPRVEPLSPSAFSVKLTLAEGAPRPITAALSAPGATLSTDSLTLSTGRVESRDVVTMTQVPGDSPAVLTISTLTLGGDEDKYSGFTVASTEAVTNVCTRTDKVRNTILDAVATDDTCSTVPVSALAATTELNLASTGIRSLQSGDFFMLTGLRTLDLGSNDLSALPGDVFSGLTDLRTLDLGSNDLSALPGDVFSGLTDLRTLDLANNQLAGLPAGVFEGLTRLTEVRLDGNPDLITLRVKAKFDPPQLPSDFRSSTMTLVLREGAPRPITVEVTATGATPTSFPLMIPTGGVESDTFVTITRGSGPFELTFGEVTLGGDDNQYTGIQVVTGEPFEDLVADICGRTQIVQTRILEATPADDACDAVATSELQAITRLGFGFDELESIQLGDFSGLTGLQTLRIMDPAVLLPANIFSELSNLQTLILEAGVFLRLQSGAFSGLNNLRTLNFSGSLHTSQRQLPANIFSGLINLQTLNFSGNPHLETLPDNVFSGLTNLRTLNLQDNYRLRMLPTGVFRGLTSLTSVRLEKIPNVANPMPLPFTFTVRPEITYFESAGETVSSVRLTLREGAPRPITAALSATGATLSADSLTIPTGHVESATTVTMTRLPGSTSAVLTISELTLGGSDGNYDGFNVVIGEAVTDICDRTNQVEAAILAAPEVTGACEAVSTSELRTITDLNLSFQQISSLQADDFSGLTGLQTLNVAVNMVSELPDGIFSGLDNLETLDLSTNNLDETLPAGIFSSLTNLRELNLAASSFNEWPAGIFSGLTNLRELNLAENDFPVTFPADIFSGLTQLRRLDLFFMGLGALPAGLFSGLSNLTYVDLSGGPVDPFILTVKPSVESLSPSAFSVRLKLAEGAPRPITAALSATGATLSTNSITLPTGRVESRDIVTMTQVPGSASVVLTINELTLGGSDDSYDGLNFVIGETVTDVCDRTSAVKTKILTAIAPGDDCGNVPVSVLTAATELNLASTGIRSLRSGDFLMLPGLRTLDLGSNDLSALPDDVFSGLTDLRTLDLASNDLSALPDDVFSDLINLRTLDLASNGLGALPGDVFSGLTNLRTLNLAGNQLTELPAGVFSNPTNLRTLDLRDNDLDTLPDDVFSRLTLLRTLNLAGNQLTELPAGVFEGLTRLTEVHLGGNPETITLTVRAQFDPPRLRSSFRNAAVTLALSEGAPRPITVEVTVTGAMPTSFSLTIPTGGVESDDSVEITRGSETFELTLGSVTLGGTDADYSGFTVVTPPPVTIDDTGLRLRLKLFLEGALE